MPTPARTSVQAIVTAARTILEAEGLEGLTMQRVAQAVGVQAPSLYKRVRDRGDLVRLISNDTARELSERLERAAASGDPVRDLRAVADAFRAFARERPAAFGLLFAPVPESWRADEALNRAAAAVVVRLAGELAGPERALDAARLVVAWAQGFLSMELAGAFRLGGDVDEAWQFGIEAITASLRSRPRRRT
jgi:AcrR family transcriptional regulator